LSPEQRALDPSRAETFDNALDVVFLERIVEGVSLNTVPQQLPVTPPPLTVVR
jgi:hypothetical protein